jgi:hypothetical protein
MLPADEFADTRSSSPSIGSEDDDDAGDEDGDDSSTASFASSTDAASVAVNNIRVSANSKLGRGKSRVFASQLVFGSPDAESAVASSPPPLPPSIHADSLLSTSSPSLSSAGVAAPPGSASLRSSSGSSKLMRGRRGSSPRGDASIAVAAAAATPSSLCQQCGKGRIAARVVQRGTDDGGAAGAAAGEPVVLLLCRACVDLQVSALYNDPHWTYERLEGGKLRVHAGTLEKLVEQLAVADAIPDWDFIEDFLVTFRYFTTGEDLLARLVARYAYELPETLDAEARETALKWKGPVQIRVINVLKKWLETHFYDFEPVETSPLTRQLNTFVTDTIAKNNERWASSLRDEALQQRRMRVIERAGGQSRKLAASDPLETIAYAMKRPAAELVSEQARQGHEEGRALLRWRRRGRVALRARRRVRHARRRHRHWRERMIAAKLVAPCTSNAAVTPYAFVNDATALYQFAPLPNDPLTLVYPKPLWTPAVAGKLPSLVDVAPEELARQLTLLASAIYLRITTNELKSQAWAKADAKQLAPNLTALIAHFNRTSYFVASNLVTLSDAPTRALALKRFVQLADAF